jgi:hypothetical protein
MTLATPSFSCVGIVTLVILPLYKSPLLLYPLLCTQCVLSSSDLAIHGAFHFDVTSFCFI